MMRSTLTVIILLFLAHTNLWAKVSYQEALQAADQLKQAGKITEAIEQYKALLSADSTRSELLYKLASTAALIMDHDELFRYLEIMKDEKHAKCYMAGVELGAFIELVGTSAWTHVEELLKRQEKCLIYTLASQLWQMLVKDQAYYLHISIAAKSLGEDSPIIRALWNLKVVLNKENQTQLEQIIAQHGWPPRSKVGDLAATAAFLVIQHADLTLLKKYIPLLEAACKEGEANWESYALLYDRIEMNEGREQLYGSQLRSSSEEPGKYEPWPIKDPQNVNKRRAKQGMQPMEDYLARWGIDWKAYLEEHKQNRKGIGSTNK